MNPSTSFFLICHPDLQAPKLLCRDDGIMSPFLRISFMNFEMDPGVAQYEEKLKPYCVVYIKEVVETGGPLGGSGDLWCYVLRIDLVQI